MLNESKSSTREFIYYDEEGMYIGQSKGESPDEELLKKAHFVFDANIELIHGLGYVKTLRRKLENLRKELIAVPVADMQAIMELNREIRMMEHTIFVLERSASDYRQAHR